MKKIILIAGMIAMVLISLDSLAQFQGKWEDFDYTNGDYGSISNWNGIDWAKVKFDNPALYLNPEFYKSLPANYYNKLDYRKVNYVLIDHTKVDGNKYLNDLGCNGCALDKGSQPILFSEQRVTHPNGEFVSIPGNYPKGSMIKATEKGFIIALPEGTDKLIMPSADSATLEVRSKQLMVAAGDSKVAVNGDIGYKNGEFIIGRQGLIIQVLSDDAAFKIGDIPLVYKNGRFLPIEEVLSGTSRQLGTTHVIGKNADVIRITATEEYTKIDEINGKILENKGMSISELIGSKEVKSENTLYLIPKPKGGFESRYGDEIAQKEFKTMPTGTIIIPDSPLVTGTIKKPYLERLNEEIGEGYTIAQVKGEPLPISFYREMVRQESGDQESPGCVGRGRTRACGAGQVTPPAVKEANEFYGTAYSTNVENMLTEGTAKIGYLYANMLFEKAKKVCSGCENKDILVFAASAYNLGPDATFSLIEKFKPKNAEEFAKTLTPENLKKYGYAKWADKELNTRIETAKKYGEGVLKRYEEGIKVAELIPKRT